MVARVGTAERAEPAAAARRAWVEAIRPRVVEACSRGPALRGSLVRNGFLTSVSAQGRVVTQAVPHPSQARLLLWFAATPVQPAPLVPVAFEDADRHVRHDHRRSVFDRVGVDANLRPGDLIAHP